MKIDLNTDSNSAFRIDSYDNNKIVVNGKIKTKQFILLPDNIIENWRPDTIQDMTFEDLEVLTETNPELVLVGTGMKLLFPSNDIIAKIQALNIGIEVMDTGAACRCYNLLQSEGRSVNAAFFLE